MAKHEEKARKQADEAKAKLDQYWSNAYDQYLFNQWEALKENYDSKASAAILRLKPKALRDPIKAAAQFEERVQRIRTRYQRLFDAARASCEPFNLDSPVQMAWLLRDHLGYDITNFEGEESTGVEVLERLAAEGKEDVKQLLEYREGSKLVTAFFPSYREMAWEGRIHATFMLGRTRTGRTASSSPNLQQVPGHIRDIFVADPGHSFIIRDYSGIEPVVIAYYSQDPILCDLLINRGGNFHSFNTPAFFPYVDCPMEEVKALFPKERDAAKELGLMLLYGGGWRRIKICMMKRGFKVSDAECRDRYEAFKELYQGVYDFKLKSLDPLLASGKAVTNLLGRKLRVSKDDVHMKGLNTLVQSSASDLLLHSSYKIACSSFGLPRLWVHDEVLVSARKPAENAIDAIMTSYKLPTPYGNLPLKVEGHVAKYWKK
jgi:DNA polymerase-1